MGVETIKRQTMAAYGWLVIEVSLWAQAYPTACRQYVHSVCDMNSAAAAAVCGLWRYSSVMCLCLTHSLTYLLLCCSLRDRSGVWQRDVPCVHARSVVSRVECRPRGVDHRKLRGIRLGCRCRSLHQFLNSCIHANIMQIRTIVTTTAVICWFLWFRTVTLNRSRLVFFCTYFCYIVNDYIWFSPIIVYGVPAYFFVGSSTVFSARCSCCMQYYGSFMSRKYDDDDDDEDDDDDDDDLSRRRWRRQSAVDSAATFWPASAPGSSLQWTTSTSRPSSTTSARNWSTTPPSGRPSSPSSFSTSRSLYSLDPSTRRTHWRQCRFAISNVFV